MSFGFHNKRYEYNIRGVKIFRLVDIIMTLILITLQEATKYIGRVARTKRLSLNLVFFLSGRNAKALGVLA